MAKIQIELEVEDLKKVCSALRSYAADLEWGEGYHSSEAYRSGLKEAKEIRLIIQQLEVFKES